MKNRLARYFFHTLHPEIFHGRGAGRPFFEGWYFKMVDAVGDRALAVIPGVYKGMDRERDHAFIMTLDGLSHEVHYYSFPLSQFAAAEDSFHIRIGPNVFSKDFLTLNLPEVDGHLRFENLIPWPVTWKSPGIMGWYAWFPMECYHGVVSMNHTVRGELKYQGTIINFEGGRGYIEKDWGRNFPRTWIWIQANNFPKEGISLSASIARIPFYGRVFPGFIIGLWLKDRLYRFTTYLGATLERVTLDGDQVQIKVFNKKYELRIDGNRGETARLYAPTPGKGMIPRVRESVGAKVVINLKERYGPLIFNGESSFAGMEIEGETAILLTENKDSA